jgi:sulfur-carrier protein adenylyltransferase/sulfurtransferase
MRWKQFLTPVNSLTPSEAKAFIADQAAGSYRLLDVRQPKEYAEKHLPGSILMPLPGLADRLDELERDLPLIVYCAGGGRSRIAAQLLTGQDFKEVYNLQGGINAWFGHTATSRFDAGMTVFTGDETLLESLILAYGLEGGLEGLYRETNVQTDDQTIAKTLFDLVMGEAEHKQKIFDLYCHYDSKAPDQQTFEATVVAPTMEDGITLNDLVQQHASLPPTLHDMFDLAIMTEVQTLDLYARCVNKSDDAEIRTILLALADEKKVHLAIVAAWKDQML